jgi:hypothetical protein
MDHEEMLRRFQDDLDELDPETRARIDAASEHLRGLHERGEYSPGKPGEDNFAIGLDDNYQPFPLAKRPGDTIDDPAQPGPKPTED